MDTLEFEPVLESGFIVLNHENHESVDSQVQKLLTCLQELSLGSWYWAVECHLLGCGGASHTPPLALLAPLLHKHVCCQGMLPVSLWTC